MCVGRDSWAQNDQIQNGNSTDNILDHMEQEVLPPTEPEPPSGRGTFISTAVLSYVNSLVELNRTKVVELYRTK